MAKDNRIYMGNGIWTTKQYIDEIHRDRTSDFVKSREHTIDIPHEVIEECTEITPKQIDNGNA